MKPADDSSRHVSAVTSANEVPSGWDRRESAPAKTTETMPIGYVVASAVFLAIAVVGFGLWLALEVF
jgi:hypothetical protein